MVSHLGRFFQRCQEDKHKQSRLLDQHTILLFDKGLASMKNFSEKQMRRVRVNEEKSAYG